MQSCCSPGEPKEHQQGTFLRTTIISLHTQIISDNSSTRDAGKVAMDHAHQHLMRSGSSRFYMRSLTHSVIAHRLHYSRRRTLCSNDTRSYLECLLASQKDREKMKRK